MSFATWIRIDVAASHRSTIGELLTQRHRYQPGSAYRTRVSNQIRRLVAKCRRLV